MKITKKNVEFKKNEEIEEICGILKDKRFLFNSFHENKNFYKGSKLDKVKKFFEKIEYDKSDNQQKSKILKNYVDNYLNIIG